ncbi:nucleotide sugar dehydrogenase [Metabacillus fastidiosus]|uniref:Nucleotide sugar dehydrogenase n=1 Tax=Metabacillus fastidiosus TaxID=1458 RepID=A0ABU6P1K4_9BACI|nr:nucleotide sugar dehydrogenase [Metabacillus fastidiosus]MED4403229.1 nucleotide sugar dehydrogenase [Metabacillus fastidiosus]MED4461653.1 nucleotide sugar dehydrogenase [Metabacillus fastidiosus]
MKEISGHLSSVAVIGLGKIGFTLAAVFANKGFTVYGADVNEQVVNSVNDGKCHIKNEPGLEQLAQNAYKQRTLSATLNTPEAVKKSDVVIVIVPVLVDEQNNIDYQYIDPAVEEIAKGIKKGTLIIFETTLPTGDTRNRFGKKIEEISKLRMGEDFYLAYSPERVYSNRIIQDLGNYPKVVGGLDGKSLELASAFYEKALGCELIKVSSLETAEFSKVAECVYRDVNIALANELAKFADDKGVNMPEVIAASNSQPFSHLHFPGVGVGGHCIPIYPYFFINKGLNNGITSMAREVNDKMSDYAVLQIEKEIGSLENKNILILGLAFRENVKETTKSSTLLLIKHLREKQANIFLNDPLFNEDEIKSYGAVSLALNDKQLSDIDVLILQAFHEQYKDLDFNSFSNCKMVLDGRNVLNKEEIESLGMKYKGIGN